MSARQVSFYNGSRSIKERRDGITMETEDARALALFKYGIIAPVIGGFLSECSKEEFYRKASGKEYLLPDGTRKTFKPSTIKKWVILYKTGGVESLISKERSDKGKSRSLTEENEEQIRAYKEKFPKITGQKIYEKLLEDGHIRYGDTSVDSIYRYLRTHDLSTGEASPDECLAFEFDHANDCWQADTVDGPYIKAGDSPPMKTYLISFIDDASRLHPHSEFFFNDNGINVQKVLKKAILKAGLPRILFDDNGGSYRNHQLDWICAQLGIQLIHSKIYHPQGKGCVERSHRTVQQRFFDCTDFSFCHSLDDLNQMYWSYLERDYQNKKHSSLGMSPRERYMQDYGMLKFIEPAALEEAFLHYAKRRVNKTGCITISNAWYEVPQKYIGQKIDIRYNPEDMNQIYIYDESSGTRMETAKLLNKSDNRKRKRKKNISYAEGGTDNV